MDALVKRQSQLVKAIKKISLQINKDPIARKNTAYGETKLQTLQVAWEEFEQNNTQIEALKSENPSHKYFTENFYEQTEGLFEQNREQLEDIIRAAIERKKKTDELEEQSRLLKKQEVLRETLEQSISDIDEDKATISREYVVQKITLLNKYWDTFVMQHGEITSIGKFAHAYFDNSIFAATEKQYVGAVTKLETFKSQFTSDVVPSSATPYNDNNRQRTVKLSPIDIPKFGGDYLKWPCFRDLFTELIHKNEKIPKAEKLYYLKAVLTSEPSELIQHLNISSTNYDAAWKLLDRRYNNKRILTTVQLKALCNQAELSKETAAGLKGLHDTTLECLEAIKNLGLNIDSWDPIIVHLLLQKLDKESRRAYEQSLRNPREIPSLTEFMEFIEARFNGLESIEPRKQEKRLEVRAHHGTLTKNVCPQCKGNHKIYACETFKKLNITQKYETVKRSKLCSNCLMKNHLSSNCKSHNTCFKCNKKHHTLLHVDTPATRNTQEKQSSDVKRLPSAEVSTHTVECTNTQTTVLLATATIRAIGHNGTSMLLRALIDQGAQTNFITEDAVQRLQLPKLQCNLKVTGVGGAEVNNISSFVKVTLKPRFRSEYLLSTTAVILRKLTRPIPSERLTKRNWSHTDTLTLADPHFDVPGRIDMILGVEVLGKILLDNVRRGPPRSPIAQQTEFGWILSGEIGQRNYDSDSTHTHSTIHSQCYVVEVDLGTELRKFWEIEEIQPDKALTPEEIICETHYNTTVTRRDDGRYVVRLPFKQNPELANMKGSREIAVARLLQMERRFKRDKAFEIMYKDFMKEYLRLGHMRPVTSKIDNGYYLSHHAVLKDDSITTKLRVVFDGTAKRHDQKSLNDVLLVGPQIQQKLTTILLRWRKHKVAFTADIEKMYRQIMVDVRDQPYQRILWRESPDEEIKEYQLTTVTYGTASAPFLAIRTLQQLGRDTSKEFPMVERIIMKDTYVDDITSGGDSLEEAVQISNQLIDALKSGGFTLRKWNSNRRELLMQLPRHLRESSSDLDFDKKTIKALGVYWVPSTDCFRIKTNIDQGSEPSTKRELLSEAAKVFDPIGFVAPVTIKIKLLFQGIWAEQANWDDPLPEKSKQEWKIIRGDLGNLSKLEIPRWLGFTKDAYKYELHGFSDASERAYSAVIYSRIISPAKIFITLLTAKTKVAPLKTKLTLPKLELCGAVLLAKLFKETIECLEIPEIPSYAWSDSQIVLSWIRGDPHRWKTFVGNRVSEIQSSTIGNNWHYVESAENPADIASRGTYPSKLLNNTLWWEGPYWLKHVHIPFPEKRTVETDLERKRVAATATVSTDNGNIIDTILQKHSSLKKSCRIIAYCKRFFNKLKGNTVKAAAPALTTDEIEEALMTIIKRVQDTSFHEDLLTLRKKSDLSKTSRLISLNPFLDANDILRVGGRIENADLEFEQRHPIIIPHQGTLTSRILDEAHQRSLHGGNTLTLEVTRQKYWIINGLKAVKGHIHKCVRCHRQKAQTSQQLMGTLPKARVTPSRPFTHTGVDYAGPFDLLLKSGRGNRYYKGYIAIFICLSTKAIHIEVVTDLTSRAFIAAFRRFVSRRGPVAHIYSDNATNFVGASKILNDLINQDSYKGEVNEALRDQGTHWHFIPPSSPHFGGLWEAGVKSIKHHMRRVIGETKLTYEEMSTLMNEIEACLNSRPLCPLSQDPESLEVLTPGHFLTGAPILTVPDKDHLEIRPNLLKRWDRAERMFQDFWKKWSIEYLGRLQQRPKWVQQRPNPTLNDLVLIKEENLPPSRWALGRIIEMHPGADGLVRAVTLRARSGILKRPITKLSLLPINNEKEINAPALDNERTEDNDAESDTDAEVQETRKGHSNREQEPDSTRKRNRSELGAFAHHASSTNPLYCLLIIATFVIVALAEGPSAAYRITSLTNHEGIYFEEVAEVRLYHSEWNIIVYYNLTMYWKELAHIQTSIQRLEDICEEEDSKRYSGLCEAIIQLIKHQFSEIEHLNMVLYQQNEQRSPHRSKRAPIEVVGTMANMFFGILDQEFARKYEAQIEEIKENDQLIKELLRNQTSILETTVNVLQKKHETIRTQVHLMEEQIEAISAHLNHSEHKFHSILVHQTFNSAAMFITLSLSAFREIQRGILTIMTDVHHGKISTLLITPDQFIKQLSIIRDHLPPAANIELPGFGSSTSIATLYKAMYVRTRITENNVLFDVRIPLINKDRFLLYEMIPIPTRADGFFIYILPSSKYLAISERRDRFSPLNDEELRTCKDLTPNQLVCSPTRPIFTYKSNQSHCEIQLYNNEDEISPFCNLKKENAEDRWRRLHHPSAWLFSLKEKTNVDIVCGTRQETVAVTGNGILQLHSNCTVHHKTFFLNSNSGLTKMGTSIALGTARLPNLVNDSNLQSRNLSILRFHRVTEEIANQDFMNLTKAIEEQKQRIKDMSINRWHNVHHYSILYILIIGALISATYVWCRRRKGSATKKGQRPTPTPRSIPMNDLASEDDLPSIP